MKSLGEKKFNIQVLPSWLRLIKWTQHVCKSFHQSSFLSLVVKFRFTSYHTEKYSVPELGCLRLWSLPPTPLGYTLRTLSARGKSTCQVTIKLKPFSATPDKDSYCYGDEKQETGGGDHGSGWKHHTEASLYGESEAARLGRSWSWR